MWQFLIKNKREINKMAAEWLMKEYELYEYFILALFSPRNNLIKYPIRVLKHPV